MASPPVPGSGVYRLLLRSDKVLRILREERPDVVEAQACGLPVVGVRAGAMLDRVPAGVGRLGAVDSPEEMAANIQALAADRREMGSRARRLVEAEFSWQRTFEQVFALYRRLNGERSRQHAGPWTWADREQPSRFSLAGR